MATQQKLTPEDVRAIAELAKLELSEDEIAEYSEQLSQILTYFTRLQEVDTSVVNVLDSVSPLKTVWRADQVQPALTPQEATANAPQAEDDQFKVNAVLGDE